MNNKVESRKSIKSKVDFAFFGTGNFAVGILQELKDNGITPELIITSPDAPAGRHLIMTPPPVKIWAISNNISYIQPVSLKKLSLSDRKLDVFLVSDFGKIIPDTILRTPRFTALLTHQSLLPKFRGPSPIQYTILNGETETGVTILIPDNKVDHGKIVAQNKVTLSGKETSADLEKSLSKLGGEMLVNIIPRIQEFLNNAKEQEENHATFTKKIEKPEAYIQADICLGLDTNPQQTIQAERNVRAFFLSPIAYTILKLKNGKDCRIQILKAKVENDKFIPLTIKPEGKKEMGWEDFKRGNL